MAKRVGRRAPDDFPSTGRFRTWDQHWNPTGYADVAQYPGQQPLRFPEDWTPFECVMASGASD